MDTNSFYTLECELLLDDRLVHLPDPSQVFGAVAGDCVYEALLDLFKFVIVCIHFGFLEKVFIKIA